MRIRWVNVWKPFVIVLLTTVAVALCAVLFMMTTAHAVNLDWAHGDIQYGEVPDQALYTYPPQGYPSRTVTLGGLGGLRPERQAYISYFHSRGAWDYGDYSYGGNEFPFVSSYGTAIRLGSDRNMYRVTPGFPHAVRDVPNSDDLIFPIDDRYSGFHFTYYKDFPSKLRRQAQTTGEMTYSYDQTPDFVLRRPNGTDVRYNGAIGISDNGKWAVLNAWRVGLVRIDLTTFDVKRISTRTYEDDPRHMPMSPEFAISNDGMHVAIIGRYVPLEVYDVSDTCGDEITNDMTSQTPIASPCAVRDIRTLIDENYTMPFQDAYAPSFDDGGGQLTLYVTSYGDKPPLWIQLTVSGYTPTPQLTYLALGDSYSSGEGDTEKDSHGDKYYRDYTDVEENKSLGQPREKCHISARSYPYHLAAGMKLTRKNPQQWDTVTCSGAQVYDMDGRDVSSYLGQGAGGKAGGTPRLKGYSNAKVLQAEALNEMIPGRVKQIEFVKKYHPKTITLTAGGNDLGFGEKVSACVTPSLPFTSSTCEIATDDGKAILAQEIRDQFSKLKSFYEELYEASGNQAKIYVLGYPQFISGKVGASCAMNVGSLNYDERRTITQAVLYFNTVIKDAANAAGAEYVDIEKSLDNHKLCDSDDRKYVTGITNVFGSRQESFHPNAMGHTAIALSVIYDLNRQTLLDYDVCPDTDKNICPDASVTEDSIKTPSYFQSTASPPHTEYEDMGQPNVIQRTKTQVALPLYALMPDSNVKVIAHSDPTDLGTYPVASDGSLDATITIPDSLSPGYHTLYIQGQTYSGEPIQYEQVILVESSNPHDRDGDGIDDSKEQCLFIGDSGIDIDNDGIDDACDPEIVADTGRVSRETVHISHNDNSFNSGKVRQSSPLAKTTPGAAPVNDESVLNGKTENSGTGELDVRQSSSQDRMYIGLAVFGVCTVIICLNFIKRLSDRNKE